jgi:hypothetical protein
LFIGIHSAGPAPAEVIPAVFVTGFPTTPKVSHDSGLNRSAFLQICMTILKVPRRCGRIAGCRAFHPYPRACVPGYSSAASAPR